MTVAVHHIPTSDVALRWAEFGPFVAKAARRYGADYDLADMQRTLLEGRAALFGVSVGGDPVAAIVTSEIITPKRQIMLIELVGGENMREWFDDALAALMKYATNAGYDAIRSESRAGWRDWAKHANFKQIFVGYERDLGDR